MTGLRCSLLVSLVPGSHARPEPEGQVSPGEPAGTENEEVYS